MVRDIVSDVQVIHQWLNGQIKRARDDDLSQTKALRLFNQLVCTWKNGRLQDRFEELLREEPHAIFSLALVTLKKEIVEDLPAILVRHRKDRQAQQSRGALPNATKQARLVLGIEGKRVDKICTDQGAFEIVKCRRCHTTSRVGFDCPFSYAGNLFYLLRTAVTIPHR